MGYSRQIFALARAGLLPRWLSSIHPRWRTPHLAILAGGDSYGYAIIKRVTELSGGHLQWTDGMLYPVLHRLEHNGHVAAKWSAAESGRRRKYYRITREGRAQLAAQRQQWQVVDDTLRGIWMKACTV